MPDENLHERIQRIRDHINNPPWPDSLTQDQANWSKLCASLDAMEDTELAVKAYREMEFPSNDGGKYLFVYGLLQSCYVQQDALEKLTESLGIPFDAPWKKCPELGKIRDTRNDTVGHPSLRRVTGSSHVISRVTMGKEGFWYVTYLPDGNLMIENVSTEAVVEDQLNYVSQILDEIVSHLEQKEKEHKEKFMDEKLVGIFQYVDYPLQKMAEATLPGQILELGKVRLMEVKDVMGRFKQALIDRGHADQGKRAISEECELAMAKLEDFYNSSAGCIDHIMAHIFVGHIEKEIDSLKEWAREIDEEYKS